jgi:hypothetical protein
MGVVITANERPWRQGFHLKLRRNQKISTKWSFCKVNLKNPIRKDGHRWRAELEGTDA